MAAFASLAQRPIMSEQELKLHVPAPARAGIEREIARGTATRVRLHALYFDTPDRELARARVAIRLRKEGRQWVQTLKTPGDHALSRIELNHERPGPVLDLSVYADTPVAAVLASLQGELAVRYETDISRLLRRVRTRHGTVEIAYDTGWLRAGELALPVSEVEFELVSGKLDAVFDLGRRWQHKFGLVLDLRSKSHRGDALANTAQTLAAIDPDASGATKQRAKEIARYWAPQGAGVSPLHADMDASQALRAVTYECLEQVVANAVPLAEVDTAGVYCAGGAEHVHQLRVGMRRMRSAWKLFQGWTPGPSEALVQQARELFASFGESRDADVLQDTVLPTLERAGMPALKLPPSESKVDAGALAASREFQGWVLDMLAWTLGLGHDAQPAASTSASADDNAAPGTVSARVEIIPLSAPPVPTLTELLSGRLRKWHRRLVSEGERFLSLEAEPRHELRKRGKRLRYGLAFAEPLLNAQRLRPYRKQLSEVQDILGEMNDLYVAQEHFEVLSAGHTQAWFARGWIVARLDTLGEQAQSSFHTLGEIKPFWK
ncbi:Adenylate cyclase [plant metagenome]|uniref:Adenylate cyclase n=1 Tax=plant metagenome TaxID=1297885 RepID=A0A484PYE5_9ZZZZ